MVFVLIDAWPFARRTCIDLIRKVWLVDEKNDSLIMSTLQYANDWDEDTLELAIKVVSRTEETMDLRRCLPIRFRAMIRKMARDSWGHTLCASSQHWKRPLILCRSRFGPRRQKVSNCFTSPDTERASAFAII